MRDEAPVPRDRPAQPPTESHHRAASFPMVVLISGRGSNLAALFDAIRCGRVPAKVVAVISNRPGAAGLERARVASVDTQTMDHRSFENRDDFEASLREAIDAYAPRLVILAGFMRVLGPSFVAHYAGRLINIHPSLLPEFQGLHTHERALAAGVREHGASVHFVTQELDQGPIILRARVKVDPKVDDVQRLAARVLEVEHRALPSAVSLIASGRVTLKHNKLHFDGEPRISPFELEEVEGLES